MTERHRVEGWSGALRDTIARHQAMPFEWGVSDCARMLGDCLLAVTGSDPLAGYRWTTPTGAKRALKRAGASSAVEFFARHGVEIGPAFGQRGDFGIVAGDVDALMAPAVIDGAFAFSKNESGNVIVPISALVRVWAA